MDYEKLYKEALQRAKDFENGEVHYAINKGENIMHWIFPELAESEDEKIRKWLINLLSTMQYHHCDDEREMGNKALDWLEKQNKQILANSAKTCKDTTWSEEDEKRFNSCLNILKPNSLWAYADTLNVKWLKSIKDRIVLQSQQEWSEKDENRFNNLIFLVEHSDENKATKEGFIKFINKLKSLRPQTTWKPSVEQMADLYTMMCECRPADHQLLQDLYYGLKTLRGE